MENIFSRITNFKTDLYDLFLVFMHFIYLNLLKHLLVFVISKYNTYETLVKLSEEYRSSLLYSL